MAGLYFMRSLLWYFSLGELEAGMSSQPLESLKASVFSLSLQPDLLNFKKGWLTKQYEDGQVSPAGTGFFGCPVDQLTTVPPPHLYGLAGGFGLPIMTGSIHLPTCCDNTQNSSTRPRVMGWQERLLVKH